jgi:hypothetical protein
MNSGTESELYGVWGSSAINVFAVGSGGTIRRYNGITWSSMSSGTTSDLYGVWGSSATNVLAVGDNGTIRRYNGSTWSSMSSGTTNDLHGVWGSSDINVFAVGDNGTIRRYNGITWSSMSSGTTSGLYGVWGSSATDVFAVGLGGTILHYNGSAWSLWTSSDIPVWLHGVWGSSATNVFVVASGGIILHYDGTAWSPMTSGTINQLYGVWGSSPSDVFTVGIEGTILHYLEQPQQPPTITSVSPNQGNQGETLDVTITGTYFMGATVVSFGSGITINSFTVNSSTQITASIAIGSSATLGVRDVSVTTPGGTVTKTSGFAVNQASVSITSVSPNQGNQGETLDVTITGTYFTGATAVSFGSGITVNSFTVNSSSQITASIAISGSAALGSRDISVTTPGGMATKTSGFTVNQASVSITSVSPNQGNQGETLDVTITGTYFTGATAVSFGSGITVNSFTVDSASQITASISVSATATLGARDVLVTTPAGIGTKTGGFTCLNQASVTITSVSPNQGNQGETLDVTITGTYFTGATSVSFGSGITVNSFTVNSSSQITASVAISSSAVLGDRDVSVTTPEGTVTKAGGFTVNQASVTITSVSPNQGNQGEALDVTITGTYFTGATSVSFGSGITVNSFTVNSSNQITANITISSLAMFGDRDISVTTPEGTVTKTASFTVGESKKGLPFWVWIAIGVDAVVVLIAIALAVRRAARRRA